MLCATFRAADSHGQKGSPQDFSSGIRPELRHDVRQAPRVRGRHRCSGIRVGSASTHDQRHCAAGECLQENRLACHQRVALRPWRNARAHRQHHGEGRLYAGSAGARTGVSSFLSHRARLRQSQRPLCDQRAGGRARRVAPHGIRAGGASVRPHGRAVPRPTSGGSSVGRSSTASFCCRPFPRIRRWRTCCRK